MANEMAHGDELVVVHAGLHEVDLPGYPLKVADVVSTPMHLGDLVVQAGIHAGGEQSSGVCTLAVLHEEEIHQHLPVPSGFEVRSGHLLEPAVVAELGSSLLLGVSGYVHYFRWLAAELAFVFFVVLRVDSSRACHRSNGALFTFSLSDPWVSLAAGYAAVLGKLFYLPGFVEPVASSVHGDHMPHLIGEFNVS